MRTPPTPYIAKSRAAARIDAAAGRARLRYLPDTPWQSATYTVKAQQAADFLSSIVGGVATRPPGSYIAAEAAARGITPRAAAQLIAEAVDAWDGAKGPAIEAARIKGRLAVSAANSSEAVASAMQAALDELNNL